MAIHIPADDYPHGNRRSKMPGMILLQLRKMQDGGSKPDPDTCPISRRRFRVYLTLPHPLSSTFAYTPPFTITHHCRHHYLHQCLHHCFHQCLHQYLQHSSPPCHSPPPSTAVLYLPPYPVARRPDSLSLLDGPVRCRCQTA